MKKHHAQTRGFTLIELMVTISLAAILMMIAVPSFVEFQRNAQLTSFANNMLASINGAKGEAMKRGESVVIVPLVGTDWTTGMTVFLDRNSNQTYEATDILIQQNSMSAPDYLKVTANNAPGATPPYMRFDGQGYPNPVAGLPNFGIEIKRNDVTEFRQKRYLLAARTGRLRICTPTSASDALCDTASN